MPKNTKPAFERMIYLLSLYPDGHGLDTLLSHLNTMHDITRLRLASRFLSNLQEHRAKAFKTIYLHTPPHGNLQLNVLPKIGLSCGHLIIKIAYPKANSTKAHVEVNRSGRSIIRLQHGHDAERQYQESPKHTCEGQEPEVPSPAAWKFVVQRRPHQIDRVRLTHWEWVLSNFPNIRTLTIACNGDPAWPGCTDIEMVLIKTRICMERINFERLRAVILKPFHAMGIMHFRWAGCGAYGESKACLPSSPRLPGPPGVVWQRLESLELRVRNPYVRDRLDERRRTTFDKVFLDYWRSFSPTLITLVFGWIDGQGPNPLLMVQEDDASQNTNDCIWARLEELRLHNVTASHEPMAALKKNAPALRKIVYVDLGEVRHYVTSELADAVARRDFGSSRNAQRPSRAISPADSNLSAISNTSRSIPIKLGF
ncbi:hypothetical protein AAFC00_001032 [Neodothiora populina]